MKDRNHILALAVGLVTQDVLAVAANGDSARAISLGTIIKF